MQRSNSISTDAMQKIINSFKQVERKIDKLQDDVCMQGKTLSDLRFMVGSLTGGSLSPDKHAEDEVRSLKRRREKPNEQSHASLKRKVAVSNKVNKAKSYDPVVPKSPFGARRPQKPKKAEALKKYPNRSVRKTANDN